MRTIIKQIKALSGDDHQSSPQRGASRESNAIQALLKYLSCFSAVYVRAVGFEVLFKIHTTQRLDVLLLQDET